MLLMYEYLLVFPLQKQAYVPELWYCLTENSIHLQYSSVVFGLYDVLINSISKQYSYF